MKNLWKSIISMFMLIACCFNSCLAYPKFFDEVCIPDSLKDQLENVVKLVIGFEYEVDHYLNKEDYKDLDKEQNSYIENKTNKVLDSIREFILSFNNEELRKKAVMNFVILKWNFCKEALESRKADLYNPDISIISNYEFRSLYFGDNELRDVLSSFNRSIQLGREIVLYGLEGSLDDNKEYVGISWIDDAGKKYILEL